jgi:hypothetical protein
VAQRGGVNKSHLVPSFGSYNTVRLHRIIEHGARFSPHRRKLASICAAVDVSAITLVHPLRQCQPNPTTSLSTPILTICFNFWVSRSTSAPPCSLLTKRQPSASRPLSTPLQQPLHATPQLPTRRHRSLLSACVIRSFCRVRIRARTMGCAPRLSKSDFALMDGDGGCSRLLISHPTMYSLSKHRCIVSLNLRPRIFSATIACGLFPLRPRICPTRTSGRRTLSSAAVEAAPPVARGTATRLAGAAFWMHVLSPYLNPIS